MRRGVEGHLSDWPIIEGLSVGGPFNRSRALNEAAGKAGDWDVAAILDADTIPDFENLRLGIEAAHRHGSLVLPHTEFRSLTKDATRSVLAGTLDPAAGATRWVTPETKSSVLCVGRDLWGKTGGFDERFEGWGFEDAAFFAACQALAGITRLSGPVHHLWHPRSAEKDPKSGDYQCNRGLGARYKAARRDAEAMRGILAEPGGPLA